MNPIDLQINGYAGTDFNSPCTTDEIRIACENLASDGVVGILATIITGETAFMIERLKTIVRAREEFELIRHMILGIHIEGPFISGETGYVGAHNKRCVMPAGMEVMRQLVDASGGLTRVVTLAPEQDQNCRVTRWLSDQSIVVSAGHTNASIDQLHAANDNGLSMFTHLGNGCPMQLHRHDNIIQRALSLSDKLWCCFIADGVHVDFIALKNYIRSAGVERCVMVTDAISAAKLGPGTYRLSDWEIEVGDDLIAMAPDGEHFVGSTMTMPRTMENLAKLGFNKDEIEKMVSSNPRAAIGLPANAK